MRKQDSSSGFFTAPICIVIGTYFLYGAWHSFADAKWPFFMPPQLDGIAFVASLFSPRVGAYVAGTIAGIVGALLCLGALLAIFDGVKSSNTNEQ